jgi:hypothetical protein
MQAASTRYGVAALSVLLALISWELFRFERNTVFVHPRLAVKTTDDNRKVCSEDIKPTLENIDDYDWVYCSSDLRPFWASLNITENEFIKSSSLFEAASTFGDLDRDGNDERILRLTLENSVIRFVILKQVGSKGRAGWINLTHWEIRTPHLHLTPEARVVTNGRASWLAITYDQRAWGTGILQENETWYELANSSLNQVLSFPQEVNEVLVARPTIHRQVKAEVSMPPFDGAHDRVDVALEAMFGWGNDPDPTITVRHKVSFAKDPGSRQFRFDEDNSDITERTYRAVCDLESNFTYDDLVDFAHEAFVKLTSGTDEEREHVRAMLPELTNYKTEQEFVRLLSHHNSK